MVEWFQGDACDGYSWTTACPMDTMASGLALHILEKVLCQWGRLQVPLTHARPHQIQTRRSCSSAVLDTHPERRWGTVSGQSAPNPMRCVSSCCQPSLSSPLDGIQANGKPLVSSTRAQTTTMVHGPDGPTRGRAEAMWGWHQNRSSKAGKVLHMRSHAACCVSMMRTNVPDVLVAMG